MQKPRVKTGIVAALAQSLRCRVGVGQHSLGGQRLGVRHEVEVVVTSAEPGGAPVGVERNGVDPRLGKAKGKVGIEGMQTPDIRQEDKLAPRRVTGTASNAEKRLPSVAVSSSVP
jgi:hypothetical protein